MTSTKAVYKYIVYEQDSKIVTNFVFRFKLQSNFEFLEGLWSSK